MEAHGKWNIATAVPPEDVDATAALQRSTNMPIATGEGLQTHWNFRDLYVTVASHNPNGPVCTAISVHLAAAIPNFVIVEKGAPAWEWTSRLSFSRPSG